MYIIKKNKLVFISIFIFLHVLFIIFVTYNLVSEKEKENLPKSNPIFSSKNYNLNTQFKNDHYIKCSYSYGNDRDILDSGDDEVIDNHIVCLIVKKEITNKKENFLILNTFPAFEFINLNNRLSPLKTEDFLTSKTNNPLDKEIKLMEIEIKDGEKNFTKKIKNVYVKKQVLLEQEKNTRLVATKIIKLLLSSLSYGAELSILDTVRFVEVSKNFQGIYNRPLNMSFDINEIARDQVLEKDFFSNNLRTIQAIIKPIYEISLTNNVNEYNINNLPDFIFNKTNNKVEVYKDYKVYQKNDEDFKNITFDLYDIIHTLTHEYGHHLTLYNEKMDGGIFLDLLKKITENTGVNEKFEDFQKFYKYINRLNDDESKNIKEGDLDIEDYKDYDKEMLKIYRKYYSGRVTKLKNKFTPYSEDDKWQSRTFNDLSYGILKENALTQVPLILRNAINKTLSDASDNLKINEEAYNELIELINNEEYNVYYWDKDDSFYFVDDDPYRVTNFWFVSKNFGEEINRKPAKVSDVFNNQQYVLNRLNKDDELAANRIKIKENACSNEPINFAGLGLHNFEAELFINTTLWGGEESYEDMSKKADVIMLNKLKYYFSWKELSARLFAIITFRYLDGRNTISTCSRDYKRIEIDGEKKLAYSFQKSINLKTMELYSDYSMFRVFGIKPLNKVKEVFSFFHDINDATQENIEKPFAIFKTNDLQKSSQQNGDNEYNYFLSNNYNFTNVNKELFGNSLSGYALLNINGNVNLKNIKIKFKSGIVKNPSLFNYNNLGYFGFEEDSSPSIDNYDGTKKVFLFDPSKFISLSISLGWYERPKGNLAESSDWSVDKKINGDYNSQKIFSFADINEKYSAIDTIWIDKDGNDEINANEEMISVIS